MFRKKFIISLLTLAAFFLFCLPVQAGGIPAGKDRIIICIDPGHGGAAAGFECTYDGAVVREKDLNLSIALKLRDELLEYENVDVIMTREDDTGIKIRP